jgi:hypothetical protein
MIRSNVGYWNAFEEVFGARPENPRTLVEVERSFDALMERWRTRGVSHVWASMGDGLDEVTLVEIRAETDAEYDRRCGAEKRRAENAAARKQARIKKIKKELQDLEQD